jgi:hypothetical protein
MSRMSLTWMAISSGRAGHVHSRTKAAIPQKFPGRAVMGGTPGPRSQPPSLQGRGGRGRALKQLQLRKKPSAGSHHSGSLAKGEEFVVLSRRSSGDGGADWLEVDGQKPGQKKKKQARGWVRERLGQDIEAVAGRDTLETAAADTQAQRDVVTFTNPINSTYIADQDEGGTGSGAMVMVDAAPGSTADVDSNHVQPWCKVGGRGAANCQQDVMHKNKGKKTVATLHVGDRFEVLSWRHGEEGRAVLLRVAVKSGKGEGAVGVIRYSDTRTPLQRHGRALKELLLHNEPHAGSGRSGSLGAGEEFEVLRRQEAGDGGAGWLADVGEADWLEVRALATQKMIGKQPETGEETACGWVREWLGQSVEAVESQQDAATHSTAVVTQLLVRQDLNPHAGGQRSVWTAAHKREIVMACLLPIADTATDWFVTYRWYHSGREDLFKVGLGIQVFAGCVSTLVLFTTLRMDDGIGANKGWGWARASVVSLFFGSLGVAPALLATLVVKGLIEKADSIDAATKHLLPVKVMKMTELVVRPQ